MGSGSGTAASARRQRGPGPRRSSLEGSPDSPALLPLQYDKLTQMVKEFQPYLDLWTTASDWLRWSESWMNDPLSAIDAEQLEKNVTESFKTMHKCVKQFKDIPGRQPSWPSHSFLSCAGCFSFLPDLPGSLPGRGLRHPGPHRGVQAVHPADPGAAQPWHADPALGHAIQ